MSGPTVSVIIPVYNCQRYLAEAIDSVLGQTYREREIVLVDDGSTDASAEIARSYGPALRCYFQPNGGISAARNRGVHEARGDFFAFLDADDVWTERKLELQVAAFAADSHLDVAFGHMRQARNPELPRAAGEATQPVAEAVPGYLPSAMMVKRESFLRVGPFDARWRVGEFADWYLRATEMGLRVAMLPELLVWRRLHEANNWTRQRESRTDYLRVLKASLDRRRAAGLAHDSSAGNAPSVGNALVGDATGGVPPLSPDGGDEV